MTCPYGKALMPLGLLLLGACSKEYPPGEFVARYEKDCSTSVLRGDFRLTAMPFSESYERAKWGAPLGEGKRVVVSVHPKAGVEFDGVFLVGGADTFPAVLQRRIGTFETGNTDIFSMVFEHFPEEHFPEKAKLFLKNVDHGIGTVEIPLKNCSGLELRKTSR